MFIQAITLLVVLSSNGYRVHSRHVFRKDAEPCNPEICKLPDCFCSGTKIPGGLNVQNVPQMVMISFDDAVNVVNFEFYKQLFKPDSKPRRNPNGCNITATFFVSHEYTNYRLVEMLRHWRHEIADHSITHRTPTTWWKNASYVEWKNEIDGQREIIKKFGHVDVSSIRGFRAPFLQVGGNKQFQALADGNILYDSSMPVPEIETWPFSLDYKSIEPCAIKPCPTDSFPGVWEVPMTEYTDSQGRRCSMVDQCTRPKSVTEAYNLLMTNFQKHYKSNRSPFPIFMHSAWFSIFPGALKALEMFMDDVLKMENVYFVSLQQAIAWVRHPTQLENIKDFTPWQCQTPPPPVPCQKENVCEYFFESMYHYLRTCETPCPKNYPWYGNPDGN
eukprot:gene4976-5626_t